MEWALHGANILILCSFLVRDILALRLLSIGAGVLFCLYFYANEMYEPIAWNVLFSVVNIVQIGVMWYSRRKIPLTPEEQFVKERFFPTLQPAEIRALFKAVQTHRHDLSEQLTFSGLGLIVEGQVTCGRRAIGEGHFIGVREFLTQTPADLQFSVEAPVTCLCWPIGELRAWAGKSPERNNLLLRALSHDLLRHEDR